MGYTTKFVGGFSFDKTPSKAVIDYINSFSLTRHVKRDTERIKDIFPDWKKRCWKGMLGEQAEYFLQKYDEMYDKHTPIYDVDSYLKRNGIEDDNNPPESQPSLWCQWIINNKNELVWNGAEKFYEYDNWLEYLIENFFQPEGLILSGRCMYIGERGDDWGYICIDNNKVMKIPSQIEVIDNKDVVTLRMPDVLKEELENVLRVYYGIDIESALKRFFNWCIEEPEQFKAWYEKCRV